MKKINREWVKSAIIVFFGIMLLLRFFVPTIMNHTLVEVVTDQPSSGVIANTLRGNATAEANNSYAINVTSPRHVLAVHVREGEEVREGDLLFELAEGEDDLLSQLQDLLSERRLAYQKALLEIGADYTMQNETIRQAREDLQRAVNERNALGTTALTETAAQARVDDARAIYTARSNQLAQLEAELTFVDNFDSRSTRISQQIIAYENALADFIREMGMSYDAFILAHPGETNTWVQAVERTKLAMETAAAGARADLAREISAQSSQVTTAQTALTEAENVLTRVRAIAAADENVRMAQRALNAAIIGLTSEQQQNSVTEAQRLLDLQAMAEEIEELEERIRRIEGGGEGDDNMIRARYSGTIMGITVIAGQTAEPGIPLARIEVAQMGYVAELSIDARQAQLVRPGAEVAVQTAGWAHVTGRVAGIRADQDDPNNRRIVMVDLQGDVTVGEQLNLSITLSSARYEVIVPRSAIGQDATGYHVYLIQSRSSPLGTRYVALRVDVTIEAEDETQAAVRGLDRWSTIIVRSSGTISDRDAVRLANQ